jgi:amidase
MHRALCCIAMLLASLPAMGQAPLPDAAWPSDAAVQPNAAVPPDASIETLRSAIDSGRLSAEALTRYYLDHIEKLNSQGPALHAVITVNPDALEQARALDRARRGQGKGKGKGRGRPGGPLEGIPVLIKDNIETRDRMPTTAGSLALLKNFAPQDAPVVASLRAAGAIILGKTNLSEWANFRSTHAMSGWSAVGGLTRNPYVLDRSACGSSSGSAAALAADLAPAALGSETDGSVTCPASMNGIVGLKPTLGLLSQRGIVPIAHSQDTAGPMARSVTDVARLLGVMTGHDYLSELAPGALGGKRIGVLRFKAGADPGTDEVYERALARLRAAGATLIDVETPDMEPISNAEQKVLVDEFKDGVNAYLAATPAGVPTRDLAALIGFDRASPIELEFFGQELLEQALASGGTADPGYQAALETSKRLAGEQGIDRLLRSHELQLLVAPTATPAWRVDLIYGDVNGDNFTTLAAVAGDPHLSVPMGQVRGLPVGLSFIGPAHSEQLLLDCGFAFEGRGEGFVRPKFLPSLETSAFGSASAAAPAHEPYEGAASILGQPFAPPLRASTAATLGWQSGR